MDIKIKFFSTLVFFALTLTSQAEQARIALIIGNGDYAIGKLKNPVNDAVLMEKTLKTKGFDVTTIKNASRRKMKRGIRGFTKKLVEGSVGLFYFAGHGIEFNGQNYLIPVDADIETEADVEFESINVGRVLSGLKQANNGLNLVILDACRNNPYARSFRSGSRGLTRMQPASGSLILYATEPGNVASDGIDDNGVFTEHLVNAINQPSQSIEKVFKITAREVSKATNKKQTPYIEGVILGDFYFDKLPLKATTVPLSVNASDDHEKEFWRDVKMDPSEDMFRAYIAEYPNGHYVRLAKIKLKKILSENSSIDSVDNIQTNNVTTKVMPDNKVKAIESDEVPGYFESYEDNPGFEKEATKGVSNCSNCATKEDEDKAEEVEVWGYFESTQ